MYVKLGCKEEGTWVGIEMRILYVTRARDLAVNDLVAACTLKADERSRMVLGKLFLTMGKAQVRERIYCDRYES